MEFFDLLRSGSATTAVRLIESQIGHTNDWIEENTPAEREALEN
jgi:hypothetical protein